MLVGLSISHLFCGEANMSSEVKPTQPIKVFLSYSPNDERLKKKLDKHLSLLKRQEYISSWDEQQILAGDEKEKEISKHLEDANLVLCLISPDFIQSDYCYTVEMPYALEKKKAGKALVIPILLKPVDWQSTPFHVLQVIPRDGKPIGGRSNLDNVLASVVKEIKRVVEIEQGKNA